MSSRPVLHRMTVGRRIGLSLMLLLGVVSGVRAGDIPTAPTIQSVSPATSSEVKQAISILKEGPAPLPTPAPTVGVPTPAATLPAPTAPTIKTAVGTEESGDALIPVGCASCSGGVLSSGPAGIGIGGAGCGCGDGEDDCGGCPVGGCYPGRKPCDCCGCDCKYLPARIISGFVHAICCPDPCYEGRWFALGDAAFFTDATRPITQTRLRVDRAYDAQFPDRSEFLWPKIGGKGPMAPANGPLGERRVNYTDFRMLTEGAVDKFSISIEVPFRSLDAENFKDQSGLTDMVLGTKTLLLDSEMVQTSFQFKTYLPTGNGMKGLGTQHVSLEPALLSLIKLYPNLYLQSMIAYRIPLGGTGGFAGGVINYHASLNHMLWSSGETIQVVGTLEAGGYNYLNGSYTDPLTGNPLPARSVGDVFEVGPGIRFVVCNQIDLGLGGMFAITKDRYAGEFVRFDFRWRF